MLALRSSSLLNSLKVCRFSSNVSMLTTKSSAKEEQEKFWRKNAELNRPLSPHLTIYRLPLTANMSIMHRATGAALSGVVYSFGLGSLYWSGNFDKVFQFLQDTIPPHYALGAKFLLALPFVYHIFTGVRHLVWDTGRLLELKSLYQSGYTIIPLVFIIAAFVATR